MTLIIFILVNRLNATDTDNVQQPNLYIAVSNSFDSISERMPDFSMVLLLTTPVPIDDNNTYLLNGVAQRLTDDRGILPQILYYSSNERQNYRSDNEFMMKLGNERDVDFVVKIRFAENRRNSITINFFDVKTQKTENMYIGATMLRVEQKEMMRRRIAESRESWINENPFTFIFVEEVVNEFAEYMLNYIDNMSFLIITTINYPNIELLNEFAAQFGIIFPDLKTSVTIRGTKLNNDIVFQEANEQGNTFALTAEIFDHRIIFTLYNSETAQTVVVAKDYISSGRGMIIIGE